MSDGAAGPIGPDAHSVAGLPPSPIPGWSWRPVCPADTLLEGGMGHRFECVNQRGGWPAFVVRYDKTPRAYLNRCAHVPVELDWDPGRFFDDSALYLVCASHGALYDPTTGTCVAGPCRGQRLVELDVMEHDQWIWVLMFVIDAS